ncbi:Bug family tripartite tricarboxylate transporter substrate binding protein [Siccirubricoccus phaeus]|uniref:Bug family tripartite tricarboxylate transporter substrate binding protein n=1 Tax=Siccirubricoccus phaeus TaxID=2595053 RepID=UPI0011F12925|nr:tripartite tricarboxylate transporter substrate binding protein [Siccirubricoccus phaeus]
MIRLMRRSLPALAAGLAAPARAQAPFPSRPVVMIAPAAPGGPTDVAGRVLVQYMPALIGQPVVLENRSGAAGQIGMRHVATAAPDGHTLVIGNTGSVGINPSYYRDPGYDIARDFTPVSMLMIAPVSLVVPADLPVRTPAELVAHIRAAGGRFTFGSSGTGQSPHVAAELFRHAAGVEFEIVPYRGAAPAVTDMLAGTVQAMFDSTSSVPFVRQGRLRALAVANVERSPLMPEVPTMAEAGFAGFDVSSWYVALAPAGTPAEAVLTLNAAMNPVMARPDVAERLAAINAVPMRGSPADAAAFVGRQLAYWREVLARAGIGEAR